MDFNYLRTRIKGINRNLSLCSYKGKDNNFIFKRKGEIVARIYKQQNSWYIWYEKLKCRQPIGSYSEAIVRLEKEFPV